MKRICVIIAVLVLVLVFTQCKKNNDTDPTTEGVKIALSVDEGSKADVNPGAGTVTFQDGDVIYVGNGGKYVGKLTRTSGVFTGNIKDPVEGEPLYFYFLGNITPGGTGNYLSVVIADQTSSLPIISCGTSTKNYSSAITSYSSKLMNKCALAKFNVTTSSTAATCITGFKNEVNVNFSSNTITFIKVGKGSIKLPAGNGEKWAVLLPQNALEAGEAGSAFSADENYNGTRGAVPVISENGYYSDGIQVQVTNCVHEYVDLGLPSGTLWATCNMGADTPEGSGDYFSDYCSISGIDLATANWGTDWCTPSYDEWVELYQNTTNIWTTQNGEYGRLFTATNGNSLFLPTTGYYDSEYDWFDAGYGYYWSRSIAMSNSRWYFSFNSNSYYMRNGYYGDIPIRPVRSDSNAQTYMISVSANPSIGGTASGGGTCKNGISCTVHAWANTYSGYVFANWTENGQVVSTDAAYTFTVSADRNLVANFAIPGAINGKFSINSNGDQVCFSQGNLQYQASSNTWRFAEHQYDCVGSSANSHISSTYSGWIDLFGWGTSGYNHGANCYQPWSTSTTDSDYYAYGSYTYNLYDQTGRADWGYNSISNGGNRTNVWRTLTSDEWRYVFITRNTTSGIRYAKAKVSGAGGVILLPDDWSASIYNLNNTNSSNSSYLDNIITADNWVVLEQAGAVFLPATGYRNGTSVFAMGNEGSYWSSFCSGSVYAGRVSFSNDTFYPPNSCPRSYGCSVRLVHDE